MAKDLFSTQSSVYARFRPTYPDALIDYLMAKVDTRIRAWDCATGNGQVATKLAEHFTEVCATDISEKQLLSATPKPNVSYSVQPAESTNFPDAYFDLVTVAQAYHWFNFEAFAKEAKRVVKPAGLIAIWGYNLLFTSDERVNELIYHFYNETVGPFWDPERRYLENNYNDIPFPFGQVQTASFSLEVNWNLHQIAGYFQSWSSVQHYIKALGHDPVLPFINELQNYWPSDELKQISFPLFLKLGRID